MSFPAEPAIKSYFFGKGYSDLRGTIVESWRRNLESAQEHFKAAAPDFEKEIPDKALALLRTAAAISVVVFGTAFFLAVSAVHVLLLLSFFLLIYLGFSAVLLTEKTVLFFKKYFTVCPECHTKYPLPSYFCPSCEAVHQRLIPSSYGILYRTCRCGEKLPATFFLNRGRLTASCPHCEAILEQHHTESRKLFVPVVGATSVGKTAFLSSALAELLARAERGNPLEARFLEAQTAAAVQRIHEQMSRGLPPDKTLATLPRALNLQFERDGAASRVLYLYDPAGEAFAESDGLVLHRYQEYFSGVIFLIDPFAIPRVAELYGPRMAKVASALKISPMPIGDALGAVLRNLQATCGLGPTDTVKQPLAVVVNKIDAFDLDDQIGEPALTRHMRSQGPAVSLEQAQNDLIRQRLIDWGVAHVVQRIETRFARVRYFACTSLGRLPDDSDRPFRSRGTFEPLEWILSATDSFFAEAGLRKD